MEVVAENSTISLLYTTRRPAELLRENYPLGYFGITLSFAFIVGGFISNCFLFDWLRKQENTTLLWVKHLICWNNDGLVFKFLNTTLNWFTEIRLEHSSRIACKGFRVLALFLHCAPILYVAAVFVDQALFMTIPTWHYKQDWKKEIPKISAAITLYCLLYSSPMVFINDIRVDSCETIFLPLWVFLYTFNFILVSFLVSSSNIIFIFKLRQKRMKKNNAKQKSNVATNEGKNAEEKTQNPKFSFSVEDLKAVKVMLFFFFGTLVLLLTLLVLSFLVRHLADNQFQMDFWVVLDWVENFGKGLFPLLFTLSRESTRKSLMNRYLK